jgi:hypothetical protein
MDALAYSLPSLLSRSATTCRAGKGRHQPATAEGREKGGVRGGIERSTITTKSITPCTTSITATTIITNTTAMSRTMRAARRRKMSAGRKGRNRITLLSRRSSLR